MTDTHAGHPAVEDRQFDIAGGRIATRSWRAEGPGAEREPILLLHDSLGAVELWRDFPARLALATGRRVVAYDRLGFGRSSAVLDPPALDFVAREAREIVPRLCDRMGMDRFIVCGHSVGGGMAAETAAAHPGRVAALITIAAQAFVEERTREGIALARADFQRPETLARLAKYHGDKARWVVDAWTETWLSPRFADWSLEPALARIVCPVLAVHGENDEYGSTLHPERIAAGRGEARLLPGIGHLPHRECPDLLVEVIAAFLARFVLAR